MTADYEYSPSNTDNLPLPVQMQLAQELQRFSSFFREVLQFALNSNNFEKKMSVMA